MEVGYPRFGHGTGRGRIGVLEFGERGVCFFHRTRRRVNGLSGTGWARFKLACSSWIVHHSEIPGTWPGIENTLSSLYSLLLVSLSFCLLSSFNSTSTAFENPLLILFSYCDAWMYQLVPLVHRTSRSGRMKKRENRKAQRKWGFPFGKPK